MSKKIIFIISILIFYFIFIIYSDFEKFLESFAIIQFEFVPIMLFGTLVAMIVKGIRQHLMLKKLKVSLNLKNSILLYFAGSSMTLTPGGIGSIIKSYFLKKKHGIDISETFPLVFLERFHDLFAIASIILIISFLLPKNEILFFICFVFSFLIFGFIVIRSKYFFLLIKKFFKKIPKINLIFENIDQSYDGFNSLTKPKITIQSWILSIIAWIIDAIVIFIVFHSFNLNFNFILTTLITHSSFLLGNLSIIPAGLGITEITATGFLVQEGIELSLATSIVVIIRFVTTWFATIIGIITTRLYIK